MQPEPNHFDQRRTTSARRSPQRRQRRSGCNPTPAFARWHCACAGSHTPCGRMITRADQILTSTTPTPERVTETRVSFFLFSSFFVSASFSFFLSFFLSLSLSPFPLFNRLPVSLTHSHTWCDIQHFVHTICLIRARHTPSYACAHLNTLPMAAAPASPILLSNNLSFTTRPHTCTQHTLWVERKQSTKHNSDRARAVINTASVRPNIVYQLKVSATSLHTHASPTHMHPSHRGEVAYRWVGEGRRNPLGVLGGDILRAPIQLGTSLLEGGAALGFGTPL
jgi:hypothetical protein